jgi:hypothetical protein
MSDFWNFEIKETCADLEPVNENGDIKLERKFHPPNFKFTGETDYYVGICYKDGMPKSNMTTDEVYQLAVDAKYYLWDQGGKSFHEIGEKGGPKDFLEFLSRLYTIRTRQFDFSWPDPFDNYFRFNRTDLYQVHPWRELIRRHFDQGAIVLDRDLMIHKYRKSR